MVAGIAGTLAILYWLADADAVVGYADRKIEAATGRAFDVAGDATLRKGWRPRLRIEGVTLADARGAPDPHMFVAEAIEVEVRLLSLVFGPIDIIEAELLAPRLQMTRNSAGEANWEFSRGRAGGAFPRVRALRIAGASVQFADLRSDRRFALKLDRLTSAEIGEGRIATDADGTLEGDALRFAMTSLRGQALQREGMAYAIDLNLNVGAFHLAAKGASRDPLRLRKFEAETEIAGSDLSELYKYTGLALPKTPPYVFAGTLVRDGETITYRDAKGRLGGSPLSGAVAFQGGEAKPRFSGELRSGALRLADIAGLFGLDPARFDPAAKGGETPAPFLSDKPVNRARLNAMNADIRLIADTAISRKSVFDEVDARILLEDGVLRFAPFAFKSGGGAVGLEVALDARAQPSSLKLDATVERLPLSRLVGDRANDDAAGPINGVFAIAADGESLKDFAQDADGKLVLYMDGRKVSHLLIELLGLDVAETLGIILSKDEPIAVRCAVADFRATSGILKARTLFFDTSDTYVAAEGSIDFAGESAALRLKPRPKDWTPLSLKSTIAVEGPIADLAIFPDPLKIGPKGIANKAANALVTTVAGLLPPIEIGDGKDADCAAGVAAAKRAGRPASEKAS